MLYWPGWLCLKIINENLLWGQVLLQFCHPFSLHIFLASFLLILTKYFVIFSWCWLFMVHLHFVLIQINWWWWIYIIIDREICEFLGGYVLKLWGTPGKGKEGQKFTGKPFSKLLVTWTVGLPGTTNFNMKNDLRIYIINWVKRIKAEKATCIYTYNAPIKKGFLKVAINPLSIYTNFKVRSIRETVSQFRDFFGKFAKVWNRKIFDLVALTKVNSYENVQFFDRKSFFSQRTLFLQKLLIIMYTRFYILN